MRCPKCQYISFGSANRCRNCGYDFSLSEDSAPLDLPIGTETEPIGPPADLPLRAPGPATDRAASAGAADSAGAPRPARPPGRTDLPLFSRSDDAPLVTPPAVPRAPLSVRRAPPITTRPSVVEDELDSESEDLDDDAPPSPRKSTSAMAGGITSTAGDPLADDAASPASRAVAGVIDLGIMGGVDLAVVYLTLRVLGLELGDAMLLPELPMLGFLLLLNGGYLVLFTAAGGQTIGKMAAGIRVVASESDVPMRVPFGMAVLRAAAYGLSLLPAGLGFLPIAFSPDHRAIHDRLAETRVVKA